MRLEGKIALITGGGSGIGRASALRFAAEGASIVASDLSEASAVETVAAVREAGGEATAVAGDVVSSDDAKAMVQAAVDAYGKLDVLVNSAGVSGRVEGVSH
ncbi:MAG: SDR family NAD(P)-dependent oxidoreductase, partial [Chloroflexi bacterium]|nr:SDR family NAD(P)-dependent oxidoreductase [Chloroflexota bacterium]